MVGVSTFVEWRAGDELIERNGEQGDLVLGSVYAGEGRKRRAVEKAKLEIRYCANQLKAPLPAVRA